MESIDSELIELLERKAPEHLTIEEIERLSARLDKSPQLQMFLIEQLQMEQYLAAALSRIDVQVDRIIGPRPSAPVERGSKNVGTLAALLAALCAIVAVGAIAWYRMGRATPSAGDTPASVARKTPVDAVASGKPGAVPEAVINPAQPMAVRPTPQVVPADKTHPRASPSDQQVKQNQPGSGLSPAHLDEKPQAVPPPWESSNQLGGPPLSWEAVALAPPPSRGMALQGGDIAQWLTTAGAWSKLRAPWPADAMLRFRLPLRGTCELRLWKGNEGALFHLAGNAGWSSFHAARDAGQVEPKWRELWETDDGLYWKFHRVEIANLHRARGKFHFDRIIHRNDTPLDLFWNDGMVHLWRGDLHLASAPLSAPPDEVYFSAGAQLEHLSMVRIEKPPLLPRYEPALAVDAPQPATLLWSRQASAPAAIENLGDGALKLSTPEASQAARAFAPLPTPGICDVVFRIDGATGGTGVYLGGADGNPVAGVQFVETAVPGHNELSLQAPWEGPQAAVAATAKPAPIWARLLVASGALRCWQSRDGGPWAFVGAKPLPNGAPPIATYGIYAAAGTKPARAITLRHVQVRQYSGLNSLAPADLLARAPAVRSANVQAWKQATAQSLPAGVDRGAWHRAAALRSLASGAPLETSSWLLRALLQDAVKLPRSVEQNRRLLAEFPDVAQFAWPLPWERNPQQLTTANLAEAAGEFADAAQSAGETRPFTTLGKPLIAARLGTFAELNYEFPANLFLSELMQLATAERYDELEQTARTAQLYARDEVAEAAQWGLELVAQRRRGDASSSRLSNTATGQLPLETSKAQRMFMDDLTGAVQSGQWARAGQLITHLEPAGPLEMFADPGDPMVWVPPSAKIASLMQQYPALAASMQQASSDKGRLRVRFAIADNDVAGVVHAATQFAGTRAASEAYQWIGDQLLHNADAAGALAWYEKALPTADVAQREPLAARLRLAHAMLGRDFGAPVHNSVRLADRQYADSEFETQVQGARQRALGISAAPLPQIPAPAGMRIEMLAAAPADRPWLADGLALAAADDTLIAQDARTVAAWDLVRSQPRWQRPLGDGGRGVVWLPHVDGQRALVAAHAGGSLQVQSLDLATGDVLGKPATVSGACFTGFALPAGGSPVFAVGQAHDKPALAMAALDLQTGQTLRESSLLPRFAPAAEGASCPPLVAGSTVLVFVEGGVICCDSAGVVRWIRKQHFSAAQPDAASASPLPTQSLVLEGDAIVWQPRVPYIERVDLKHGRRKWLRMLPEIRRIIGLVEGRLIVEADQRLVALGAADGKVIWSMPLGDLLAPAAVGAPGGILVTRAKTVRPADPNQPNSRPVLCPELVWLDPASGQMRGVWPLESLAGEVLSLGPWVITHGSIVTFFGAGKTTPKGIQWDGPRQLLRLQPQGSPQPARENAQASVWEGA